MLEAVLGVVLAALTAATGYTFKVMRDHDQSMVAHATLLRTLQKDVDQAKGELATVDQRIGQSRHLLRNEMQTTISNIENDIMTRLQRLEDKLDRLIERQG